MKFSRIVITLLLLGTSAASSQTSLGAKSNPKAKNTPQSANPQIRLTQDCNAFDRWSKLRRDSLPEAPRGLDSALVEGQRLPKGEELQRLEKWSQDMAPFEKIVDQGCSCSRYADPLESSGKVDIDALSNVQLVLSAVEESHQLRVKTLLESRKFSQVRAEIEKILDVARPGDGGTRVLISYLVYKAMIKRGLGSIRECLYWQDCPVSVIHGLVPLMNGLGNRSVAARTVLAECNNFMVPALIETSKTPDFIDNITDAGQQPDDQVNRELLKRILKERVSDFDLKATIELVNAVAKEGAANVERSPKDRTNVVINQLTNELDPLVQALKPVPGNILPLLVLSGRLAGIKNLVGKWFVFDTFKNESTPELQMITARLQDQLVMQLEGTRILIALNLFERSNGELPQSLSALSTSKFLNGLHPDRWTGYDLRYSKQARTLEFVPQAGIAAGKTESWKIPRPIYK